MTTLATERKRWRADWRRLCLVATAASAHPSDPTAELRGLAAFASGWLLPTGEKSLDLVPVAFMHVARAYAAQPTVERRRKLAEGLAFWASAVGDLLDETDEVLPERRFRADLDA